MRFGVPTEEETSEFPTPRVLGGLFPHPHGRTAHVDLLKEGSAEPLAVKRLISNTSTFGRILPKELKEPKADELEALKAAAATIKKQAEAMPAIIPKEVNDEANRIEAEGLAGRRTPITPGGEEGGERASAANQARRRAQRQPRGGARRQHDRGRLAQGGGVQDGR